MATLAEPAPLTARSDDRFFLTMAIAMALTLVAGFSVQLAAGRSSFMSPLLVHTHAVVFFGWVVLYLTQNFFVVSGRMALHRTLGWIGAGWMVAMVVLGTAVTVAMIRRAGVPFFFTPTYFLIMDPVTVLGFAGLTTSAIVLRRRTDWHRRLHLCGMAMLTAPGVGRLLPMPFIIPWAGVLAGALPLIFPLIAAIHDWRRSGRVHPALWWGLGTMVALQVGIFVIADSPVGLAIYDVVASGSPGAQVAPQAYPPFPLP